jgi:histidyl-tRNA synthetase
MLTSRKDISRPVKWYSFQKFWRYEEPQSGRQREFYQLNADIFGPNTPLADAEVIGLAASILDKLGLNGKYRILLNDRLIMDSLLRSYNITDTSRAFAVIDKYRKINADEFIAKMKEIGLSRDDVKSLVEYLDRQIPIDQAHDFFTDSITERTDREAVNRFLDLLRILKKYSNGTFYVDLSVVRGLAYYTGVVFEAFDNKRKYRSILGGGRYDDLANLYSGQNIPAVGFGMGDLILEMLMKETGTLTQKKPRTFFVVVTSGEYIEKAVEITNQIRSLGIICSFDTSEKQFSAQMKEANRLGCSDTIIIGQKEIEENSYTWKHMDSGKQEYVLHRDLLSKIMLDLKKE